MAETPELVANATQQDADKPRAGWYASQGRFARDPGAAAAAGRTGGPRAAAVRKKRRLMRDAARDLLAMDPGSLPGVDALAAILAGAGASDSTVADALLLAQALKAAKGDTEAARFVRDTSGERPADQINLIAGEVIDANSVAELSDAELEALAAGAGPAQALPAAAGVALPVALDAAQAPGPVAAKGPEDP